MPRQRRSFTPAATDDEKRALVQEVQRRNRHEGRSIEALSREMGLPGGAYYRWLKLLATAKSTHTTVPALPSPSRRPSPGRNYDAEARAALLADMAERRRRGQDIDSACRAVGLSRKTYHRWTRQPAAAASTFRPVAITPESPSLALALLVPAASPSAAVGAPPPEPVPSETLTLSAPGGYRIEGLTVETAAQLLRALAC